MKQLIYILLLFTFPTFAQQADYKAADKFAEWNLRKTIHSTAVFPQEADNGYDFWYKYETSQGEDYYYVNPTRKLHEKLFDKKGFPTLIKEKTGIDVGDVQPDRILFSDDRKALKIQVDTFWFQLNLKDKSWKQLQMPKQEKSTGAQEWLGNPSPSGRYTAFVEKHNVYIVDLESRDTTQMTFDSEEGYSFDGTEDQIGDNSMKPRIEWFAGTEKFFITRSDYRRVRTFHLTNSLDPQSQPKKYIFYLPGDKHVPQHELHLFDARTKTSQRVPIGKWKDQTLKIINDAQGGVCERLYFIRKKRTCDELELCRVNPTDGSVSVLFNEVCKPYFNNELYHLTIFNKGNDIIWHSERTGYGHYYHYDGEGNLLNVITSGEWVAGEMVHIDEERREIYFYGFGQVPGESPYYARLNRASIDGKYPVRCLTPEMATHSVSLLGKDSRYFVDNYSRADLAPVSVLRDRNGKVVMPLASPDLTDLYATGWQAPEPIHLKAADGVTDLYGYMWKPFNMEPGRKYPIISHVYPGPTSEDMALCFDPAAMNTALAQVGFIVVNFGHRGGSPLRNAKYHTYGYGNLRDYPLADDKYGLEQLARRYDFIDSTRVGIYGHSGGGLMSTSAICTYPDFYTAAVSSAGNHDSNTFNLWWGETHHGVQEVVRNGDTLFQSRIATNMELAKNLKGHLLLMVGDYDNTVHPSNTMRMADALVKAGKQFDLWVFPGQRHQFMSFYRDYYLRQLWFHFGKHLLGDYTSEQFSNMADYRKL